MASKKQQEVGRDLARALVDRGQRELAFQESVRWGVRKYVDRFLAEGVDVNWQGEDGANALMTGSFAGEYQIVKTLLEHGADVKAICNKHNTALHYAVGNLLSEARSKKVALLLLAAGADIHCKDNKGMTPADLAQQRFSKEFVELLSAD